MYLAIGAGSIPVLFLINDDAAIGRWACEKWVSQVRFWVSQQKVKIAA